MKTNTIHFLRYLLAGIIMLNAPVIAGAQSGNMVTINGAVKDSESKKSLPNVSIFIPGTNIATVSNDDGQFTLKIKEPATTATIEITHIGYANQQFRVGKNNVTDTTIFITPSAIMLSEITIFSGDAKELVKNAIHKIKDNFSDKPTMLTGFYRETVQKRRTYISISEAIIDMYKTAYTSRNTDYDRVQIIKGRKLLSQKSSDTLAVKLQGGPNIGIYTDVAKNSDLMMNQEFLSDYKFTLEGSIMINERQHYIVGFVPEAVYPYPLHKGRLYIDRESLTLSRAEYSLDLSDINKAIQVIVKQKPLNLRFKPEELSFLVNYKQVNGKTYISYVRNEVHFKCDWRRKLFSTNYTIVSEMVVIDEKQGDISNIPGKLAFRQSQAFSDKVGNFLDVNFWKDYNIIEPTESLESAVNKLRKQYK